VEPNPAVAGLFPNKVVPPKELPEVLALGCPNNPVPDVVGAVALLAVDPNAPPPPNVDVLPPPNAPKPVAGFGPPNSGFVVVLFVFAKAPVGES